MSTPLERKFNEYVDKIHAILHNDKNYLNEPMFINQLLDKMEFIKRNFVMIAADAEDVYQYQVRLEGISAQTNATLEWIRNYPGTPVNSASTIAELKETVFMLNDMFQTSKNLIKSIYPVT